MLTIAGYEICQATNAEQALSVVRQTPLDLILLDLALPDLDGLTLARQLKSDESTRHIKVVALTAFAMKGDDEKAKVAGCDGYITKPIDTRKFPRQVAELFEPPDGTTERAT